jgi:hypothetical protein
LPDEVIDRTAMKYREAYERVTGERFEHYRHRMGVSTEHDRETSADDLERLRRALT